MDIIRCLLSAQGAELSKINLSYIDAVLPEIKEFHKKYYVIHKPIKAVEANDNNLLNVEVSLDNAYETTGAPLIYSFNECSFEDSLLVTKRNWVKSDELYRPFHRYKSSALLNQILRKLQRIVPCPLLAICDGTDKRQTRILGLTSDEQHFGSIECTFLGILSLIEAESKYPAMLQDHLDQASCIHRHVDIDTLFVYDLFGTKYDMINWKSDEERLEFDGYVSVRVKATELTLYPEFENLDHELDTQIVCGWKNSTLKDLWNEMILLHKYLTILEDYKAKLFGQCTMLPLEFPKDFSTPFKKDHEDVVKAVNLLLMGDLNFDQFENGNLEPAAPVDLMNSDVKIKSFIRNLSNRYNMNFPDLLWKIAIYSSNYENMKEYVRIVYEDVVQGGHRPKENLRNNTKFARAIHTLISQDFIPNLLIGSQILELIIDIGFEKLSKDYMYVLVQSRFVEPPRMYTIFEDTSGKPFNIDAYRKKLVSLKQIHACIELMVLVQTRLNVPTPRLKRIFEVAESKIMCKTITEDDIENFTKDIFYDLRVPISHTLVKEINKGYPDTWKAVLTTKVTYSTFITTIFLSQVPVFPTVCFPVEEQNDVDKMYHGIHSITSIVLLADLDPILVSATLLPNGPDDESVNEPVVEPNNEPVNELVVEPNNEPVVEPNHKPANEHLI